METEHQQNHLEIERKFLVRGRSWVGRGTSEYIFQGYLNTDKNRTVRVRIKGDRGFFTVKGPTVANERVEIETEIPFDKAKAILEHPAGLCAGYPIEKTRWTIEEAGLVWEVDEFAGHNQGLVIAEVEFNGDPPDRDAWNQAVDEKRPSWVGDEVSGDAKYFNSSLTEHPFSHWTDEERAPMLKHRGAR
jgi:CYTH domain-containing protein